MVTCLAFMRLLPFLAREPTTVTSSPIFNVSRRHPRRCRPCGGPISAPQLADLTGLLVLHVDVEPHVRVRPLDLGDATLQRDRLVRVELRGKRVMCQGRSRGQEYAGRNQTTEDVRSHIRSFTKWLLTGSRSRRPDSMRRRVSHRVVRRSPSSRPVSRSPACCRSWPAIRSP